MNGVVPVELGWLLAATDDSARTTASLQWKLFLRALVL
jgi:hypothetical protein